jgi:hypothetical protein
VLTGAAAACLVLVVLTRNPVSTVSAAEVLRRAETVERAAFETERAPVLHQTLIARSGSGEADSASWEIWNELKNTHFKESIHGAHRTIAGLKSVLKANSMDERRPLSLASYRIWRERTPVGREDVSMAKLANGEDAFRIDSEVAGQVADEGILKSSLFIRHRDWSPVAEQLQVRSGSGQMRYEVVEISHEVVPFNLVAAAFLDESIPASPSPIPVLTAPSSMSAESPARLILPTPMQLWSLELKARYVLHRLGACTGEPITVTRTAERVQVRGLAETEEKKQELLQQMAGLDGQWLKVVIKTLQESGASERQKGEDLPPNETAVETSQPSAKLPIEVFLDAAGVKYQAKEVTQMSNEAISSAQALLMHAWALQHLAEQYGAVTPEEVDPNGRPLLDTMVRDHVHAIEEQKSKLSSVLLKLLPPSGAGGTGASSDNGAAGWPGIFARTLGTAKEIQQLTLALFSRGDTAGDLDLQAKRLNVTLAQLQNHVGELENALAQGMLPVPAMAKAE